MEDPILGKAPAAGTVDEAALSGPSPRSRSAFVLSAVFGGGARLAGFTSAARGAEFERHEIDVLNFDLSFEYLQAGFYGRPPAQRPEGTNLVRVHLRDGRVVEGEVRRAATHDCPVLLLDVVDLSDAQGQKTDPEPLYAFVPLAEVEHIETIGEVHERVSNATERRR
jgi:hypothetical protein